VVSQRADQSAILISSIRLISLAVLSTCLAATLAACGQAGPGRDATAAQIARRGGLEPVASAGGAFNLQIYRREDQRSGPLFVYIEGDGMAYLDQRTPSSDPTPIDPLALRLAAVDLGAAVVYLGRPCQFAPGRSDPHCTVHDWTTGRFSETVIAAVDEAVGREHARNPGRPLVLVGYSGGGVVAALVAVRRRDVALLITVATPLDPADWTRRMGLSPLEGSQSPMDHARALAAVPQVVFAGERDATVPIESTRSAFRKLGPEARARLIVIPDFDHRCCWVQDWSRLRELAWP
jgi:hypothetical protein